MTLGELVGAVEVDLPGIGVTAQGYSSLVSDDLSASGEGTRNANGFLIEASWGGNDALSEVLFLVPNLRSVFGTGRIWHVDSEGTRHEWWGRAILEEGGWEIWLDTVWNRREIEDQLDADGGYAITGMGRLRRIDGSLFSVDDAKDLLELLRYLLTIPHGGWIEALLPIGFDSSGDRSWQEWSVWQVTPWKKARVSWAHELNRDTLTSLLPGLFDRWSDEDWRQVIRLATGWYVEANTGVAAQPRIVVEQIALELLSWVSLVEERGVLSGPAFERLPGADKIRRLLAMAKVPADIPARFGRLLLEAPTRSWGDGPGALTGLRNAVVHLSKRQRLVQSVDLMSEASWLGLWYLELALLWFLGYRSGYRSRILPSSRPEAVPWS